MIEHAFFGAAQNGERIEQYTITNRNGVRASMMTLGASLVSLVLPIAGGKVDVCLGYDTPKEYLLHHNYMGSICGRFANRIRNGRFPLNGTEHRLPVNNAPNHLHGGFVGFSFRIWDASVTGENSVTFSRLSPDNEEQYPGNLNVRVTYTLGDDNVLSLHYEAVSDADTILNLTNHPYWNLNGHGSGDAMEHTLMIPATYFCPTDAAALVTGEIAPVANTPFDFRTPHSIRSSMDLDQEQLSFGRGYDHCYLLDGAQPIRLTGNKTGITLEIATDMPGVHLYTANQLYSHIGKGGAVYEAYGSLALETEQIPDAPNCPQFPSAILKAGEPFSSVTSYRFIF